MSTTIPLTIPDFRSDRMNRFWAILRDIYHLSQSGACWAANKHFAEKYSIDPATVRAVIADLKRFGFIEVEIRHGRDRYITPLHAIEAVAQVCDKFRHFAHDLLPKAFRQKKAILKPVAVGSQKVVNSQKNENAPSGPSEQPQVRAFTPASDAPLIKCKAEAYSYNTGDGPEKLKEDLTREQIVVVNLLIAQGVEESASKTLVNTQGCQRMKLMADYLKWENERGKQYDVSVTAFCVWFVRRLAKKLVLFPPSFVGLAPIKKGTKSEETLIRDKRAEEEAQRIAMESKRAHAEAEQIRKAREVDEKAMEGAVTREKAAWETLSAERQTSLLRQALETVLVSMPEGPVKQMMQKRGIEGGRVKEEALKILLHEIQSE